MKRILMSASAIVFVAALAYGATGAFFSDTETSSGNTFTAGSIDLTVDSTSHYNGNVCVAATTTAGFVWNGPSAYPVAGTACSGTWVATDLGAANQFFNFPDVKPGDQGEDTVSLHVATNDAWACMDIGTNANNENGANGPEIADGDTTANGPADGELAQNISFVAWRDTATGDGITPGDNIHQASEPIVFGPVNASTLLGATTSLALADSTTGSGPLVGNITNYVGVAWCAGTIAVNGTTGAISCDGSSMGNNTQTDSATSTVAFRVEQSRNNPDFTCASGAEGPQTFVVGANDLTTNPADGKWYFYNDTNDTVNNALGSFVPGPLSPPVGTGSAQNNALADGTGRTLFTNSGFGGVVLSAITHLSYGEYQPSGAWSGTEAPFFRFNVDFGTTTAYQGSLVYVPSANGTVTQNTWQNWDMINGGAALWTYSRNFWPPGLTTLQNTVPGTTARTWTAILADYPGIKMHALFPQLGFRTGEPGPAGLTANIDNFQINTGTGLKTYDFGN